jgi:uncharacterized small protein (DUF1192 family)
MGVFTNESPCFDCLGVGLLDGEQDIIPYSVATLALRSRVNRLQAKADRLQAELNRRPKPKEAFDPYKHAKRLSDGAIYAMD